MSDPEDLNLIVLRLQQTFFISPKTTNLSFLFPES